MEDDILFIVQYSEETKELKLERFDNARQNPNFSFTSLNASYNSLIRLKSGFVNPLKLFTTIPQLFLVNNPFNKPNSFLNRGYLYNFHAVSHPLFCPLGWHVPTDDDWHILGTFLGGYSVAGGKLKQTGFDFWDSPNVGATNTSGFTSIPNGIRGINGNFLNRGRFAWYWTSSNLDDVFALSKYLASDSDDLSYSYRTTQSYKWVGYSVRLIKNDNNFVDSLTDIEGNIYGTIQIGSQIWMINNWKCSRFNNGASIPYITSNTDWPQATLPGLCAFNHDLSDI